MKIVVSIVSIFVSSILILTTSANATDKISPLLNQILERTDNPVPVVVVMKQIPLLPHSLLGSIRPADAERMIKARTLQQQYEMRAFVNEMVSERRFDGVKPLSRYQFFWTVNAFMATATPETIFELSEREEVTHILLDQKIRLEPDARQLAQPEGDEYTYGLEKIGVPELRAQRSELTGKGVIVGILDTGIDAKHPELVGRTLAFKDFTSDKKDAYDDNGHGTHVAGTVGGAGVGGTQIGVAPDVRFVIGKVFTAGGSGSLSSILRGMDWISDPDGNPDTADKPAVINNSWGGGLGDDIDRDPFGAAVLTWVQLNIFPSFAAGNSGPGKSTLGSPGGLPQSFAVGATDDRDEVAYFSSRGPVKAKKDGKWTEYTKPDISAPGVNIYSTMPGGQYGKMSGTSMATPHITGCVAVIVQAHPGATIDQIREILTQTSDDLGDKGMDNSYGFGRVNLARAVDALKGEF